MNRSKSTSLFLIELMICILFFALSSTICMQFFVKARLLTNESSDLQNAIFISDNIAETVKAGNGSLLLFESIFPNAVLSEKEAVLYYDENWNSCNQEKAHYQASVLLGEAESYSTIAADIQICPVSTDTDTVIYELHTEYYNGMEVMLHE